MATVRLPGGPTLNYREWGRPDGAVVLLLHGLTSSSQSWRNVAPVLGEHFMEQVGILAAIVTGHSMGAVTAYDLAATRPDLIRLLVLEEMPPPDPARPPKPMPRGPDPGADYDWRAVIAVHRWQNAPPPGWWERATQIQARTLVLGAAHSDLPQERMEALAPQRDYRHRTADVITPLSLPIGN